MPGFPTPTGQQAQPGNVAPAPRSIQPLPGMSIPCGFGARGRPVGLQIVGNYFDEARMLAAAHAYQQATDWHTRVPPGFE